MAKENIDIGKDSYENIDEISTRNGISPLLYDGYKDEAGSDIKRHGYSLLKNLNSGAKVDGLWWSTIHNALYAVSGGTMYRVEQGGVVTNLGTGMLIGQPVHFVEDSDTVYMANGAKIYHLTVNDSIITAMADAEAPTKVIGLGYIDGYLLATTSLKVHFADIASPLSGVNESLSWAALSFFTPSSKPDSINSMQVFFKEVTLFGPNSIDVYYNDGSTPFARLDGAYIERGCIAGNSVARRENTIFFLDDRKQVNTLSGRTLQIVSGKINREIGSYDVVYDAIGNIITMFGKEFYVLQFPTEGKTWVYDIALRIWVQWSSWSSSSGKRLAFRMNSYAYAIGWDKHIIGDTVDGKISIWSDATFSDAGEEIRFERITGHIDHGTMDRKRTNYISMRMKRGIDTTITANTREGKVLIKHRSDNQLWSNEKTVSLGYDGDTDIVVRLWRQGIYRIRQWSIVHSDPTPFKLANPLEEDVELLNN